MTNGSRFLPEQFRDTLKQPIGSLVDEPRLLQMLHNERFIVSIGDQVTYTLLKNQLTPLICIIDYQIQRKHYKKEWKKTITSTTDRVIKVQNPPGHITSDLWSAIETAYNTVEKGSLRIEVEGEEDLAALVAIYLAPEDATIIYGLPNRGIVIVKPTHENKQLVKSILDKM